jgi:hypothetical protein
MTFDDVDIDAIRAALKQMGPEFRTRELSEREDVVARHPASADTNYHRIIGRFLSLRVADVELLEHGKVPAGALWRNRLHSPSKSGSAEPSKRRRPVSVPEQGVGGLGPQYAGDDPLARRMRLHQSWYRARVLAVPCGTGPTPKSAKRFGNMLTEADAEAGLNFITPQIRDVAERRLADTRGAVEPFRLKRNMLSSQPMCFNLFGPLVDDPALATRLARATFGSEIAAVTRVEIEWAPEPAREYLDDRTAFDAFVEYERVDGRLGFVGIETKLVEPFSQKRADKASYRRWMSTDGPWKADATTRVADIQHNQLWRDHLLAWALLKHPGSSYAEGALAVVHHPDDRRCEEVIDGYRALLTSTATLRVHPLDQLVADWSRVLGPGTWLDEFRRRYLQLDLSESYL